MFQKITVRVVLVWLKLVVWVKTLTWKKFVLQLKILFRIVPKNPPIPDAERDSLMAVYLSTAAIVADMARQATTYQKNIAEAKHKHKRDLYTRKFDNIRPKFQNELARLVQAKQNLDDNGIEIDKSTPAYKQLQEMGLLE